MVAIAVNAEWGVDVMTSTMIQANVSDEVCTTGTHLLCDVLGVLRVVTVIDSSGGSGLSTSMLGAVGVIR